MKLITSNLVEELKSLCADATHISWVTAFAMKSGAELMLPTLQRAQARGAVIQILVGDYLNITQPDALTLLVEALPDAEIRMYRTFGRSFHPKAYLFQCEASGHVIVGSSNLSKSALSTGIEWSLHTVDCHTYEQGLDEFYKLFYSEHTHQLNTLRIAQYREQYEAANSVSKLSTMWDAREETALMYGTQREAIVIHDPPETVFEPRPAQSLALTALYDTMQQGYDKAMVVLATGLGKTYLAAFFARKFDRVLFIAHREEILEQAKASFQRIHPERAAGFYHAVEKNRDAEMLFASIFTIAQPQHLQKFGRDAFDLIVIDEFHHAVAPVYSKVLAHFQPAFLLGITATPDRLDHKDVFALCDGNVALEVHFLDAIARGWLAPFHYYGVRDEIDYAHIRWAGTHYDEEQLIHAQQDARVLASIYENWCTYKQTRTIGFCSSVRQARALADYFMRRGARAVALVGTNSRHERKRAREQLLNGAVDIIFTVDLFNEGVDIPTVDTLLFVRPTESLAIFTQQIGRGLRLANGKEKCVIIDCIGNYRNADRKLRVFYPQLVASKKLTPQQVQVIDGTNCVVELDLAVVDLLKEMARKNTSYKAQMLAAYVEVKADLGRRPSYLDMYLQCGFVDVNIAREFGSFVGMLKQVGELTETELEIFTRHESLLVEIEKTAMTKSYKMVVLQAMLTRGEQLFATGITAKEVAPLFLTYLNHPARKWIDGVEDSKVQTVIEKMPMTKWAASSKGLAYFMDGKFGFNVEIEPAHAAVLHEWVSEICEFRLHRYFARKAERVTVN
ncbi:MAG: DEAD/DEAH box helicase family protein [Solibacillus sp.]